MIDVIYIQLSLHSTRKSYLISKSIDHIWMNQSFYDLTHNEIMNKQNGETLLISLEWIVFWNKGFCHIWYQNATLKWDDMLWAEKEKNKIDTCEPWSSFKKLAIIEILGKATACIPTIFALSI